MKATIKNKAVQPRVVAQTIRRRTRSPLAVAALLGLITCLLSGGTITADRGDEEVSEARMALGKWVETRRIISEEKRNWLLAREMLADRVQVVRREIESLRGKIDDANKSIGQTDAKLAEMKAQNEKLKGASASLNNTVAAMETRTKELLVRLPDAIRDRVTPLSKRMPDNPGKTELSVAQRFQSIVGILNEVNKFNREISVTSEVRALPDGTSAEVTAMYIGIGQACYAGANGKIAGIGTASADGWVWVPANSAAAQIAEAIAVLKGEHVACFVKLPIEVR